MPGQVPSQVPSQVPAASALRGAAVAVALAGSALGLVALFGAEVLEGAQDVAAWDPQQDPLAYQRAHGRGLMRESQNALHARLHAQGLIASLQASDWRVTRHTEHLPPPVQAAELSPDGRQVLTSDGTRAFVWTLPPAGQAQWPQLSALHGAHSAAAAPDALRTGWGYRTLSWLDAGQRFAALAQQGHAALWFHGEGSPPPLPLDPKAWSSAEGLAGRQGALLLWSVGRDEAAWFAPGATAPQPLPHPDLALAGWAPDGQALTLSRAEVRRWREGQPAGQMAWTAVGQPVALADDGRHALIQADEATLLLMSTEDAGAPARPLPHAVPVRAAAVCGAWIAIGSRQGQIFLWSREGGDAPLRTWDAYSGPVELLACRGERLVSSGSSGLGQLHGLVWNLPGRPQPVPPPPDLAHAPHPAVQAAQAAGLHRPAYAPLGEALRAQAHWLQPAGLALWLAALVMARALWRRGSRAGGPSTRQRANAD